MKVGDVVKVIKNDMSLIVKTHGMKDNHFFNRVGIIVKVYEPARWEVKDRWDHVLFPSGLYDAKASAIEVINESR